MTEYWEPWSPEIGQRVTGRVSAECPGFHMTLPGTIVQATVVGYDNSVSDGHPWLIQVDTRPFPQGAAAIELEPIEEAP